MGDSLGEWWGASSGGEHCCQSSVLCETTVPGNYGACREITSPRGIINYMDCLQARCSGFSTGKKCLFGVSFKGPQRPCHSS